MLKKISVLLLLSLTTLTVLAASTSEQIRELSGQLTKMQIVDATRKNYSEPTDIARRKKMAELSAQIKNLQKQQNDEIYASIDNMQNDHIQLMENLKTCKKSGAKTITGTNYILGITNGYCKYQMNFGVNNNQAVLCNFPMSVTQQLAQESINSIKTGQYSKFVESTYNKYCTEKK